MDVVFETREDRRYKPVVTVGMAFKDLEVIGHPEIVG
jgi:hypothetical protein